MVDAPGLPAVWARASSPAAQLARLGFSEPAEAEALVNRLQLPRLVVGALAVSGDPQLALTALAGVAEADPTVVPAMSEESEASERLRNRLASVLGASAALGEHLARHPEDWRELTRETLRVPEVAPAASADETIDAPALRGAYRRGLLVIAAADLTGEWRLERVMDELSQLAADAVKAALRLARAQLADERDETERARLERVRLAVIGMGKCGARELNYVSDVDVVFVAEASDAGSERADEQGELAAAARLAERLIGLCSAVGPDGALFPLDAGLRPEGRAGPLVRTLASHEAYYRRWARTWEFQALLKARPIAGDAELGRRYAEMVEPLIWSAAQRPHFVADVQAMRRRVEQSLSKTEAGRQVKLGPGGLRDVEFAVQLLQLVHGRADESLRKPGTLPALAALSAGGYVGRVDAVGLTSAYRFLRTVEHRLQLQRLRRTHTLPTDRVSLRWLARSMGFRTVEEFDAERTRQAREVRRLHEKIFYRPLLDAVARLPTDDLALAGGGDTVRLTPEAAMARLSALGFADPAAALRHLQALTTGVGRSATVQRVLLPAMLGAFADAADPDAGLLAYRRVSDALGRTPWYLRLLRDEGSGSAGGGPAERLARLLATSPFVADLLTRAPEAVRLLGDDDELRPRSREQLEAALLAVVRRRETHNEDGAGAVVRARGMRRTELVRVACADLLDRLDVAAVGSALSDAAEATLSATLEVAQRVVAAELGVAPDELPMRLAVIGMGRLGGAEMGYSSDADVLFVHEPAEGASDARAAGAAVAVAEQVRRMLGQPAPDPPLVVDANLRPEGRQGPLSRSLASYEAYYRRWSLGWEAQALLRARPVCGDVELGERFVAVADTVRYPPQLSVEAVAEMRRLRRRMELERVPRGVDRRRHLKLGPGGLTDVEWTAQLLQLRHGAQVPALRTTSTLDALAAAEAAQLLAADERTALADAWTFAMRARNAVLLTTGRASDVLPVEGRAATAVSRVLGYGVDVEQMLADHDAAAQQAREVTSELFRRVGS